MKTTIRKQFRECRSKSFYLFCKRNENALAIVHRRKRLNERDSELMFFKHKLNDFKYTQMPYTVHTYKRLQLGIVDTDSHHVPSQIDQQQNKRKTCKHFT